MLSAVHGINQIRLIALLREPAERMHSAFWYWPQYRVRFGVSEQGFLEYVRHVVSGFKRCLDDFATSYSGIGIDRGALRTCSFHFESLSPANEEVFYHADQLLRGLYAAYVPEWIAAFGRDRLLAIRAEDYWAETRATLARVFGFLDLSPPSSAQLSAIAAQPIMPIHGSNATFYADATVVNRFVARAWSESTHGGHTHSKVPTPMVPEARQTLRSFYAPYNDELARLLADDRFTWKDLVMGTGAAV